MADIEGLAQLERKLKGLEPKVRNKVIRKAIRNGAKRAKERIITNIKSQGLINTGAMLRAFQAAKIRSASRSPRNLIRIGPVMPDRNDLGIPEGVKGFYPTALEYGAPHMAAKPFIRPAIDQNAETEQRKIGREIGDGIEKEAKR